ncbi:MAG: chitobiase/beta-hexosaminidase C-terminal domain-containing protein [Prevotella sp.]|nr:chitobiase/beta-hexosaminidase C-terminal domain-containing protein [Prevotella sp.]
MAVEKIALGINLRKNKISTNAGYGKYYPEVDVQKTLSLRGFAQHMVDHGSIYGRSIVEGVLLQITDCLPELVAQGVPVQLGSLGTFYPTAEVAKDAAVLNIAAMDGLNPNDIVKAIHIRFLPDSTKLDNLCGPQFKNRCSLELRNIIDTVTGTVNGKEKKMQTLKPIATAVAEWKGSLTPDPSPTGEGSQSGSGSNTNGTNSGSENSGSQSQQNSVAAPTISGVNPFEETSQVSISGPDGATIYYSENGDDPDANDTLYTQPFTIDETTTIKAIAIKDGVSSQVTTKVFTKGTGGSGGFETGS